MVQHALWLHYHVLASLNILIMEHSVISYSSQCIQHYYSHVSAGNRKALSLMDENMGSLNKQKFRGASSQTEEMARFPPVHMSAIWGHCIPWPERAAHDRWRGENPESLALHVAPKIAFS